MKLITTSKCYVYDTESEQKQHQSKMEHDGFRLWNKDLVNNKWNVDYVKEHSSQTRRKEK